MNIHLEKRFVSALEKIASALAGIDDTKKRQFDKDYPAPRERREAIVTTVPSEEDRIREQHGAGNAPIEDWLSELGGEEFIGVREREFLARQEKERNASAQGIEEDEQGRGGTEAAGDHAGESGILPSDNSDAEGSI